MTPWPEFLSGSDLSPGDQNRLRPAWREVVLHVVESPDDPWFEIGFERLASEFAARGELESRSLLERRLSWNPRQPARNCSLLYRMMLLLRANECVAVRDHTAIIRSNALDVVVHLSHAFVVPSWRRHGFSALLRALPLQTARDCAAAVGLVNPRVTLAAEMEPRDPQCEESIARWSAYERAGFRRVGSPLEYRQPDFRAFAAIDASGPRLLPLDLLVRRVGREEECTMPAREVRHVVQCLYDMYAVGLRAEDMQPCFNLLERISASESEHYPLRRPTEGDNA